MTSTFIHGGHVRANDIRQHYLRFGGRGKQLLIVPGITSPAMTWAEFAEPLGQDFDVYVIDVRGRGLSSSGAELDYRIDALAADTAAFARTMGFEHYGLMGHSMGGRIVPVAVSRFGASPDQLMMIDPPVTGPGRRGHDGTHAWFTDQIAAAGRGDMTIDDMRPYFPRWTNEQLRLRVEWVHTCDPRAIIEFRDDVLIDDFHAEISKITMPMELMIGGQSPLITVEEEIEIAALNPLLETVRIPEAGHMIPWDTPDTFLDLTRTFFARR